MLLRERRIGTPYVLIDWPMPGTRHELPLTASASRMPTLPHVGTCALHTGPRLRPVQRGEKFGEVAGRVEIL